MDHPVEPDTAAVATSLAELPRGRRARVRRVEDATAPDVARRLFDLGFRAGTVVACLRRAPLGSPTVYRVGESEVCLRPAEAGLVSVEVIV